VPKLNHIASITMDPITVGKFYATIFNMSFDARAIRIGYAATAREGYVGLNFNPIMPGRPGPVGLDHFGIEDESLRHVARIVRGADTARLDLEPECAGLLALSLGFSALHGDDQIALEHAIALYDGLYSWVLHARKETHNWPTKRAAA